MPQTYFKLYSLLPLEFLQIFSLPEGMSRQRLPLTYNENTFWENKRRVHHLDHHVLWDISIFWLLSFQCKKHYTQGWSFLRLKLKRKVICLHCTSVVLYLISLLLLWNKRNVLNRFAIRKSKELYFFLFSCFTETHASPVVQKRDPSMRGSSIACVSFRRHFPSFAGLVSGILTQTSFDSTISWNSFDFLRNQTDHQQ